MAKSETFLMFIWPSLTQFPDYNETVFSINKYFVVSQTVHCILSHNSKAGFGELWEAAFPIFENGCKYLIRLQ